MGRDASCQVVMCCQDDMACGMRRLVKQHRDDGTVLPGPSPRHQAKAKRSMVTATAVSSFVACVLMGIVGNLPFGLAPGMGINAYFTYTVVGFWGDNGMVR
jgi:hypothetical protein